MSISMEIWQSEGRWIWCQLQVDAASWVRVRCSQTWTQSLSRSHDRFELTHLQRQPVKYSSPTALLSIQSASEEFKTVQARRDESEMFWNCSNRTISLITGNPVHLELETRSFGHFASASEQQVNKLTRLPDVDISECQYPWIYDSLKVDESDVNFRWTLCHEFVSVAHKLGHNLFLEVVTGSN